MKCFQFCTSYFLSLRPGELLCFAVTLTSDLHWWHCNPLFSPVSEIWGKVLKPIMYVVTSDWDARPLAFHPAKSYSNKISFTIWPHYYFDLNSFHSPPNSLILILPCHHRSLWFLECPPYISTCRSLHLEFSFCAYPYGCLSLQVSLQCEFFIEGSSNDTSY